MSLVLVVLGVALVAVGLWFAYVNKAGDKAGGSGLKSISVEGPAWLVLTVAGCVLTFLGVMRWEDAEQREKINEDRVEVTVPPEADSGRPLPSEEFDDFMADFPNGFTFGDNPALDELWDECGRGIYTSCDDLYFQSDLGSEYEFFAATCGQPEFITPGELWCDDQRNIDEGLVDP